MIHIFIPDQTLQVLGWTPEPYESLHDLPADIPHSLRDHIEAQARQNAGKILPMVWLSCEGAESFDRGHLGEVTYSPWQGFPTHYFPYRGAQNGTAYQAPLVAVRFDSIPEGMEVSVVCRAWAKNLVIDKPNRLGSVEFQIYKIF